MPPPPSANDPAIAPAASTDDVWSPREEPYRQAWASLAWNNHQPADELMRDGPPVRTDHAALHVIIEGRLAWAAMRLLRARECFAAAAGLCHTLSEYGDAAYWVRAKTWAYDALGTVLRRMDQPSDAAACHHVAFRIREQYGSLFEQWQSAVEAGLDADMQADHTQAIPWYHTALAKLAQCQPPRHDLTAQTYSYLAASNRSGGQFADAMEASQNAIDHRKRHEPASLQVQLARLQQLELLVEIVIAPASDKTDTPQPNEILRDAHQLLMELKAFGKPAATYAAACEEAISFLERIISHDASENA